MSLLGVFCGVMSSLFFAFTSIQIKNLRNKTFSPLAVPALQLFGLPVFLLLWWVLHLQGAVLYSASYFLFAGLWAATTTLTFIGGSFLLRYQSLTEYKSYKAAFVVMFTLLVDIFLFNEQFSLITLASFVLILFAAWQVMNMRTAPSPTHFMQPLRKMGLLLLLTLLTTAQLFFYKKALLLQENPFAHLALGYTILAVIQIPTFLPYLITSFKNKHIPAPQLTMLAVLLTAGQITEVLAYKLLPISVVVVTGVLTSLMFAFTDIKNKELQHSPRFWVMFGLMISGVVTGYIYR